MSAVKTLVFVDDSPVETMLFKSVCKEVDCEYFITESYEQAAAFCSEHKVDVLITDLNIGSGSGFDLIKVARAHKVNSGVMALIYSSDSCSEYSEKMKEFGVAGWIVKPLNPQAMVKVLNKLL